ncbi:MAG: DUF5056 domain-containing protein [Chthoniobacterales bacterium]
MTEPMDEQLENDWLDLRLREEAPYLDDAGFTARVMHQLPARRQSHAQRNAIMVAVTLLACVVAYFASGGGAFIGNSAAFLVAMPIWTVCALAGFSGLLVMVLGTAAAVKTARPPRRR